MYNLLNPVKVFMSVYVVQWPVSRSVWGSTIAGGGRCIQFSVLLVPLCSVQDGQTVYIASKERKDHH